jgi:DNA-binding response OmpR family regulator
MSTILLIEDDQVTANLIKFLVLRQGHTFHWATDGNAGLEMLFKIQPDAVILDVLIPYQDGFSVLRKLRGDPKTEKTPVLMLTGKSEEEDIVGALGLGANDFLSKPFHPAELIARLNRLLL